MSDSEHEEDLESQNGESRSDTASESGDELVAEGYVHPYQDEPLAMPGENALREQQADVDGLLPATLDARSERTIPLNEW